MPPLPALPELVAQAFAQRPEILQLQASVASAEAALRLAHTTNLPDVSADASYGLSGATFPPDHRSWSYGVAVSWPFFDVGLTRGTIETARGNLLTSQGQLRLGQQTVAQEVTQAYLDVQAAGAQVSTAAAGVTSAEESLRVATGRYEVGLAAYLEVIDAEAALTQAQTSQVTAVYGLSMARAALARAMGPTAF
jgi:outer membrane protein TolC